MSEKNPMYPVSMWFGATHRMLLWSTEKQNARISKSYKTSRAFENVMQNERVFLSKYFQGSKNPRM